MGALPLFRKAFLLLAASLPHLLKDTCRCGLCPNSVCAHLAFVVCPKRALFVLPSFGWLSFLHKYVQNIFFVSLLVGSVFF